MHNFRWYYVLAVLPLAAVIAIPFCVSAPSQVTFDTIQEARAAIEAAGYFTALDTETERADPFGFVVAREPVTWEDSRALGNRSHPVFPRWKGRVWVNYVTNDNLEQANGIAWGKVYALGDSELLAEIDARLRQW